MFVNFIYYNYAGEAQRNFQIRNKGYLKNEIQISRIIFLTEKTHSTKILLEYEIRNKEYIIKMQILAINFSKENICNKIVLSLYEETGRIFETRVEEYS